MVRASWTVRMEYTLRMKDMRMSRVASETEPPNWEGRDVSCVFKTRRVLEGR